MNNKIKISTGLASLILIGGLFSGWQTMLIVAALLLIFCDVENFKGILIRVLAFYAGITLFTIVWDLVINGYGLVYDSINNLFDIINSYFEDPISSYNLYRYALTPIKDILNICDSVVGYFVTFVKFGFIISLFENKNQKQTIISKYINKYVDKIITYVNSIDISNTASSQEQPISNMNSVVQNNNITSQVSQIPTNTINNSSGTFNQ